MKLNVILRTCSNSLLTPNDLKRVCGDDRALLIRKCFYSLVNSIRASSHEVKLTILDDHSDQSFLEFLRSTAEGLDCSIVSLTERGPNHSALKQFETAANSGGLVYVVEDDYLHEENAIDYLVGAYLYFMKRHNSPTVIYPYDCSLRYREGSESTTTLYHDGVRYWRSVDKTAFTMLTHYSTIKQYWSVFKEIAEGYPKVLEDDTINKLYRCDGNPDAPIRVFSPIPSVAYHVGYSTPTSIGTTHTSWQHLWDRIEPWDLIQGWFNNPEFYRHVVSNLPDRSTIVEIGAWRGKSTCCLASYVKQSGKGIKVVSVDTWEGSDEPIHRDIIKSMGSPLHDDFISNLKMCGVNSLVEPMRMTSVEASKAFNDGSVDFVMIDGSHDYDSVRSDIESWLPKVKKGGLIAGDDYSKSWPGVIKAVDEKFGSRVSLHGPTWYVAV